MRENYMSNKCFVLVLRDKFIVDKTVECSKKAKYHPYSMEHHKRG